MDRGEEEAAEEADQGHTNEGNSPTGGARGSKSDRNVLWSKDLASLHLFFSSTYAVCFVSCLHCSLLYFTFPQLLIYFYPQHSAVSFVLCLQSTLLVCIIMDLDIYSIYSLFGPSVFFLTLLITTLT